MQTQQLSKPLMHFSKHLFLISKIQIERRKAMGDVYSHLQKMRKSIIRMNLSYSDIDRLKRKIGNLIHWERKYAKFFKPEDEETKELKNTIAALESELRSEREEKLRIMSEQEERIRELSESLENIKHKMRHLLLEKAKRQHRLRALEEKINKKVDANRYFHS